MLLRLSFQLVPLVHPHSVLLQHGLQLWVRWHQDLGGTHTSQDLDRRLFGHAPTIYCVIFFGLIIEVGSNYAYTISGS